MKEHKVKFKKTFTIVNSMVTRRDVLKVGIAGAIGIVLGWLGTYMYYRGLEEEVKKAYLILGDIGEVAEIALKEGVSGLRKPNIDKRLRTIYS